MNLEINFGADLELGIDQYVERVRHHTFGGILNRHNAERNSLLAHLLKHFADTGSRQQRYCGTKFLPRSKMRIGCFGPEEGNLKRRFDGAASGDNFSENRADGVFGKRTLVQPGEALKDLLLPMRNINFLIVLALAAADFLRKEGPIV